MTVTPTPFSTFDSIAFDPKPAREVVLVVALVDVAVIDVEDVGKMVGLIHLLSIVEKLYIDSKSVGKLPMNAMT